MNTREWDIDYRRYVIQLRTMLAHPEGSNPWLQSRQVLDEIVDVYPDVWEPKPQGKNVSWVSKIMGRFGYSSRVSRRCSLRAYGVLVALGRQEITAKDAKEKLEVIRFARQ
jgi:hypothetical protein